MSSFMIWHKITISEVKSTSSGLGASVAAAFGFGLPLTITNNVYSLGLVLDADATVTMAEGAVSDKFKIVVYDLPDKDSKLLMSSHDKGALEVTINLGYFDNPSMVFGDHPVMRGRITDVKRTIGDDGRVSVEINGLEETGYLMLHQHASIHLDGTSTLDDVAKQLLATVGPTSAGAVKLAPKSALGGSTKDLTIRDGSVLSAFAQLAEKAKKALVIADGVVAIGPAVGAASAPIDFDGAENIAKLGDGQQEDRADTSLAKGSGAGSGATSGAKAATGAASGSGSSGEKRSVAKTLVLSVLGHPGLRVGQLVKVTNLDDQPAKPLRITDLVHKYSTKTGYVCEVTLADLATGARAPSSGGAAAVVDEWNKSLAAARVSNPAVDVGEVTAYSAGRESDPAVKHRVSMHYAQVPVEGVDAPSVDAVVSASDTLLKKPVASSFAFDKVGLVTPVYPGMRALLTHNRSLTNDAVVTGWLWPTKPASTPPPNEVGDHWLALPTGLGSDGKPQGKGVHDLTDAQGRRVVHAKGLHIVVGTSALLEVGTRPTPPDDDLITIEHSSGTKIEVAANGALTITTSNQTLTIGNGSVSIKLDGSTVAVS